MDLLTASMGEAKTNLSKLAAQANETGRPIIVLKNSKPWFEIKPLAYSDELPEETRAALQETQKIEDDQNHETFDTVQDFFAALGI